MTEPSSSTLAEKVITRSSVGMPKAATPSPTARLADCTGQLLVAPMTPVASGPTVVQVPVGRLKKPFRWT